MIESEELHAPPESGETASPCCGRTLRQLPRYDRITLDDALVTCGRLTCADVAMLSGQPVVLDPDHERIVYDIAATVTALSQGTVTLATAYDNVHVAMRQMLSLTRPLDRWTVELMIGVTARAQELSS